MSRLGMVKLLHAPVLVAIIGTVLLAGCDRPPPATKQEGYRGLGMVDVNNPRELAARLRLNAAGPVQDAVKPGGSLASADYKNVKVLGDVRTDEFNRLMLSITEWVAPEQGCTYCHNVENLADDSLYTKVVARRMIEMTRHINSQWKAHVQETGVTCYACHRGNPVPVNVWHEQPPSAHDDSMVGNRAGQNAPSKVVGLASLPNDPFKAFLDYAGQVRVIGKEALPVGQGATIQQTEASYGLMMHFSQALGVNCTGCHNSRSFFDWDQSNPRRVVAWHGIRMVRDLNASYIEPLKATLPAERLGPLGDPPKLNCATCHQGVVKPLNGASMLKTYPELAQSR